MRYFVALLAAAVVAGRLITGINGEGGGATPIAWERSYIDFAHLVVFGMIGAGLLSWWDAYKAAVIFADRDSEFRYLATVQSKRRRNLFLLTALTLTIVEVVVAVAGRRFDAFGELLDHWNVLRALRG